MTYGVLEQVALGLLCMAMVMASFRLVRGPTAADRIIALDLLAVVIVGFMASASVVFEQPVYLDVATALAVIAFIGTVAYSRFLLQRKLKHDRSQSKESA